MSYPEISSKPMPTTLKRYPVGVEIYRELVTGNFVYVDKSYFIKQMIEEGSKVVVITRPRRFGKTLGMSMLQHFFADTVYDYPTKGLFDHSWLAKQYPEMIDQYQGQYSVINVSLKGVKPNSLEQAMEAIRGVLSRLFYEHEQLLKTGAIDTEEKRAAFKRILTAQGSIDDTKNALLNLSILLKKAYEKPVIIIIDEYDTSIQVAYLKGFYPEFIEFMRGFFGASLKGNPALDKGIITGITRVARESLFSDLNNTTICTILDDEFSDAFGFTEEEAEQLLKRSDLTTVRNNIKKWYNGYQIGKNTIYNPWSIINCIRKRGELKAYWVNTSSNGLLKSVIAKSSSSVKLKLKDLMQHHTIDTQVDLFTHFDRFETNESSLWNLLVSTGYLTANEVTSQGLKANCQLRIPNLEIMVLYENIIESWFEERMDLQMYHDMLEALTTGHIDYFYNVLKRFLRNNASFFDPSGEEPEKFYHGLILGMLIYFQSSHQILSNREAGFGRYDVAIIPKNKDQYQLAVLIEFKTALTDTEDLQQTADKGLKQIQQKHYQAALETAGITEQLLIGLAFRGKQVAIAY